MEIAIPTSVFDVLSVYIRPNWLNGAESPRQATLSITEYHA